MDSNGKSRSMGKSKSLTAGARQVRTTATRGFRRLLTLTFGRGTTSSATTTGAISSSGSTSAATTAVADASIVSRTATTKAHGSDTANEHKNNIETPIAAPQSGVGIGGNSGQSVARQNGIPISAANTDPDDAATAGATTMTTTLSQQDLYAGGAATGAGKENRPPIPESSALAGALSQLELKQSADDLVKPSSSPTSTLAPVPDDPVLRAERARHLGFIEEALEMARLALVTNETPVGCVLVHDNQIIAKGMNATNVTRNGTRHAEFMAISALLSLGPVSGPTTTSLRPRKEAPPAPPGSDESSVEQPVQPDQGNEDGSKGHLYPYGQKIHPDAEVDDSILHECTLYVTVEPCVMCASLLRQFGVKKVFFGAVNDKFGGTGGVFSVHANYNPTDGDDTSNEAATKTVSSAGGLLGISVPPGGGDGGNVERGYEVEGGWGRDEAVALLRRFYVQENGRAPVPRKKEGRAARLAAMMEKDGSASITSEGGEQDVADAGNGPSASTDSLNGGQAEMSDGQAREQMSEVPLAPGYISLSSTKSVVE